MTPQTPAGTRDRDPSTPRASRADLEDRNARMAEDANGGMPFPQIARKYGLSLSWTGVLLKRQGVSNKTRRGIKVDLDEDEIIEEYVVGEWTVRAIAEFHEVSYGKIYRLLKAHKVPMRPRGG